MSSAQDFDLQAVLAEVLDRMDEGYRPTEQALKREYPACWRELLDLLGLEGRLQGLASPGRAGS